MSSRSVLLVAALALVAGALPAATAGAATRVTIGSNALAMPKGVATYRLSLRGTATRIPSVAPASSIASPKGRYRVAVEPSGIVLIDGRGGARRTLAASDPARAAFWSSQGLLAFTTHAGGVEQLVVLDPVHGTRRVVATGVCDASADPWSPDGRALAVSVSLPGKGCDGSAQTVVGVAQATGGAMRRISKPPTVPIAWTRDSRHLLVETRQPSGASVARLVDPRTGKGPTVLRTYNTLGRSGIWSNGHRFYAVSAINGSFHGELVIVDGALRQRVAAFTYPRQFAWAPTAPLLAIATDTGVRVFDAATRKTVAVIPVHAPYGIGVESVTWARGGTSVDIVAAPSTASG